MVIIIIIDIGVYSLSNVKSCIVSPKYYYDNDPTEDYALLIFHNAFNIGGSYIPIACRDDDYSPLINETLYVQGYSNVKRPVSQRLSSGLLKKTNGSQLGYLADTESGASGSPVWHRDKIAIAIHTNGTDNYVYPGYNVATIINRERFNLFYKYISESTN